RTQGRRLIRANERGGVVGLRDRGDDGETETGALSVTRPIGPQPIEGLQTSTPIRAQRSPVATASAISSSSSPREPARNLQFEAPSAAVPGTRTAHLIRSPAPARPCSWCSGSWCFRSCAEPFRPPFVPTGSSDRGRAHVRRKWTERDWDRGGLFHWTCV